MVYACFVAKMSKMAFTRFGGQFQFEKSNGGQVRQFWGRAPGPSRTTFSQKVNGKKLTERGVLPPPLHGRSVTKNGNFFAENGVFCPKNTVFGPIFNGFFLNGKGGYSPPPFTDGRFQKT